MDCHFLVQGTFLTEGSNLRLLRCRHIPAGTLPAEPFRKHPKYISCELFLNGLDYDYDYLVVSFLVWVFFSLKVLKLVRCFLLDQLRWSCGFHLFILLLKDSVMVCCVDFDTLSHPCIPGVNPVWLWHTILLVCFWIWLAGVLLRGFAQYLIVMLVCSFLSVFVWCW